MEYHILDKLADKFWKGECTDREELEIREVLQKEDIPEEHKALKQYLQYVQQERSAKSLDSKFDADLLRKISSPSPGVRNNLLFLKIAASLILVFGLAFILRSWFSPAPVTEVSEFVDTYQDSELAYAEVKKALLMVSTKMNDGMEHTEKLGEFYKATEEIEMN